MDSLGSVTYQPSSPCELLVVRAVRTCVFSQSNNEILILLEPLQRQREQVLELKALKLRAAFLKLHAPSETFVFL
jgi:hypothetical protein